MVLQVVAKHLGSECVHGAARRGDRPNNLLASTLFSESALYRVDLTFDLTDPGNELLLVPGRVHAGTIPQGVSSVKVQLICIY